uniref:Rab-GAP TBC domain-containing protein n=1 Tax=Rodentolepis nana TaxID=102285 RepID=A0A0R3T1D0_RODNA
LEARMPPPEYQSADMGRKWADKRLLPTYHLNERGRKVLAAVLHDIAKARPATYYAPHVWPICAILLHYHHERIAETGNIWLANRSALAALKVKGRMLDSKSKRYEKALRIDETNNWMIAVFNFPFEVMVPLMDNFITEGFKMLFRVGLVVSYMHLKVSFTWVLFVQIYSLLLSILDGCITHSICKLSDLEFNNWFEKLTDLDYFMLLMSAFLPADMANIRQCLFNGFNDISNLEPT